MARRKRFRPQFTYCKSRMFISRGFNWFSKTILSLILMLFSRSKLIISVTFMNAETRKYELAYHIYCIHQRITLAFLLGKRALSSLYSRYASIQPNLRFACFVLYNVSRSCWEVNPFSNKTLISLSHKYSQEQRDFTIKGYCSVQFHNTFFSSGVHCSFFQKYRISKESSCLRANSYEALSIYWCVLDSRLCYG